MRHTVVLKRSKPEPALWLAGTSGNAIMKATEIQQKKITHGSGKNAKQPSNEMD
jgi:hypothetical protein